MSIDRRTGSRRIGPFVCGRLASVILAALVACGGIFAVLPSMPARADVPADVVQVTLTIDAVDAVDGFSCFDPLGPDDTFCGIDGPDFYPVVHINNGPELSYPDISNQFHARPTDWVFTSPGILFTPGTVIPISIQIFDADGGLRGNDDKADISLTPGDTKLDLTVTLGDVPCPVGGDVSGTCGPAITTQGNGDSDVASITFRVDVTTPQLDSDGDGIPDAWELSGVTLNGHFIDLPAMGADPNKPDLFIQLDWMEDATHFQALTTDAIKMVVDAFANSGYVSPTGSVGINLHVDEGPESVLDFKTTTLWGSLSEAKSIPWQKNFGTLDSSGNYDWTQFEQVKESNFNPTGRSPIFHYGIVANLQEAPASGLDKDQNTSTGISRNSAGSGFSAGTSDFLLTLGGTDTKVGTDQQQAGTLMHEFGHNLGLRHGGNVDTNYKPNYPSIMNYLFQLGGVTVNSAAGSSIVVDYSHGTLPSVDEHSLDETNGLGPVAAGFGTGSRCPDSTQDPPYKSQWTLHADGPFDWNCDGDTSDGVVSADANGSGSTDSSLSDFDDWSHIKFRVGAIGDLGAADLPMTSPPEPEVITDTAAPTTAASLTGTLGQSGWYVSAVTVTLSAVDSGSGVQRTQYRVDGGAWTTYQNPFAVAAEGINTVEFFSSDFQGNVEQTQSVTVKIDLTPPAIACVVSPSSLWPPNNKLVPVTATVNVTDAGSGPAGYTLADIVSSENGSAATDIQGFTLGTPDTTGLLRAARSGASNGRTYTLTYTGSDVAGNSATCSTAVVVPHDRGQ